MAAAGAPRPRAPSGEPFALNISAGTARRKRRALHRRTFLVRNKRSGITHAHIGLDTDTLCGVGQSKEQFEPPTIRGSFAALLAALSCISCTKELLQVRDDEEV
jgi:hypothetical protein